MTRPADQPVELAKRRQQTGDFLATLRIGHLGHGQDTRGLRQGAVAFENQLHPRQEDPLQPLLERQRIHAERLGAGQRFRGGAAFAPPAEGTQLTLDQQQLVGQRIDPSIHQELTFAFCRASAAPAESPCFSRAWAISSQSPACKAGRPLA